MSTSSDTSSPAPGPHPRSPVWQPSFTQSEARRLGFPRAEYKQLVLWARSVTEHHASRDTARDQWEGTASQNEHFAAQYIEAGEQELATRLTRDVDPVLDEGFAIAEELDTTVDLAGQHPAAVVSAETGITYPAEKAVEVIAERDAVIETDFAESKSHHRRVAPWVATVGSWQPAAEWLGLLAFIAYYMDVPLLRPWEDWLGFTLSLTIVTVVIYGQTRLVHEAARKHNVAREAAANGRRHEAERARGRRNAFLAGAAIVALGITGGLILRGTAVLGSARPAVVALLVFLAVLTGVLMPVVTYLAVALDGSTISRERDGLAAALEADLDGFEALVEECRALLVRLAAIYEALDDRDFDRICQDVQETVDGVYTPYGMARLIIGGLSADPPEKTSWTLERGADGRVRGQIGTGLTGARVVDLAPLVSRAQRLTELDGLRTTLADRLAGLPPHPWAAARRS